MFNVEQITAIAKQNIKTTLEKYKYLSPVTGNSINFGLKIDNNRKVVIVYAIKTSFNNSMEYPMYIEIPSCGNLCNADLKELCDIISEAEETLAKEGKRDPILLDMLRSYIDKADPDCKCARDMQGKRVIQMIDPFALAATEIDLNGKDHLTIPGALIIEVSKDFDGPIPDHWRLSDLEEEDKMFLVMDDFDIPDFNKQVIEQFEEETDIVKWTLLITNFIDNAIFESINCFILKYMEEYDKEQFDNLTNLDNGSKIVEFPKSKKE